MTKNQLASLLGIDELMKRNFKLKKHQTMLDVLCDYLIAFKENVDPKGVAYPIIGEKSTEASDSMRQKEILRNNAMQPAIRPQTSGGPTRAMGHNAYGNNPMDKPKPMMNAFSSGSKADLTQPN